MYQVGRLLIIKPDDHKYEDYQEALRVAVDQSIDDSLYAVWDEGGELLAIVYGGAVFEK